MKCVRDKDTERVEGKAEIEQLSRKIITSLVDPALFCWSFFTLFSGKGPTKHKVSWADMHSGI